MTKRTPCITSYDVAPVEHGRDSGTTKAPDADPGGGSIGAHRPEPKKQQTKKNPDRRPKTETSPQPKKKK